MDEGARPSFLSVVKIYWRTLIILCLPVLLVPTFLFDNVPATRCLYVILLMTGYWLSEGMPLAAVSLIPLIFFPIMNIMDSQHTASSYFMESNMFFFGSVIFALAIEFSKVHNRIAVYLLYWFSCQPRIIHLMLMLITLFLSMWITDLGAVLVVCPIVEAICKEFEKQKIGYFYERNILDDEFVIELVMNMDDTNRRIMEAIFGKEFLEDVVRRQREERKQMPSKMTIAYFLGCGFAATIGNMGFLIDYNMADTLRDFMLEAFPSSPGVPYWKLLLVMLPITAAMMALTWTWLQFLYMGLWRPDSEDALLIYVSEHRQRVLKDDMSARVSEIGFITFHEIAVAALCTCYIFFSMLQKFYIIPSCKYRKLDNICVSETSILMFFVVLLFTIPNDANMVRMIPWLNQVEESEFPAPRLMVWSMMAVRMPWKLLLVVGSILALGEGIRVTKMVSYVAKHKVLFKGWNMFPIFVLVCIFVGALVQVTDNSALATVGLPICAAISINSKIHPIYLLLPLMVCSGFTYCFAMSSISNAIVLGYSNIHHTELLKSGAGVLVLSLLVILILFPILGFIFDVYSSPDWVGKHKMIYFF